MPCRWADQTLVGFYPAYGKCSWGLLNVDAELVLVTIPSGQVNKPELK